MPDIEFFNSPKSEEKHWIETRRDVANSWFSNHGFLVVPQLRKDTKPQIQVVFPPRVDYVRVEIEPYRREWEKVGEMFWAELDHYLPEARKIHEKIRVDVGRNGTISSNYRHHAHYYLRSDRTVADLAAMIINRTLFVGRKSLGITWTKREALMDFIMTRPVMKELFPHFDPVFTHLSRVSAKARKESLEYVRSLGISIGEQELEVSQGQIVIKGQRVAKELSKQEKLVMKKLIERQGELVSYDELADSVWGQGEFKTFWAINKVMERVRPKLDKLGIEGGRIESVRGQGYLLR